MDHFQKSRYLYGETVDLHKELFDELIFIIRRIHLLQDNLKYVVENPRTYCPTTRMGQVDYNQCYSIQKAIRFWENEKKIIIKQSPIEGG